MLLTFFQILTSPNTWNFAYTDQYLLYSLGNQFGDGLHTCLFFKYSLGFSKTDS